MIDEILVILLRLDFIMSECMLEVKVFEESKNRINFIDDVNREISLKKGVDKLSVNVNKNFEVKGVEDVFLKNKVSDGK